MLYLGFVLHYSLKDNLYLLLARVDLKLLLNSCSLVSSFSFQELYRMSLDKGQILVAKYICYSVEDFFHALDIL